jgi:hypothetical protein
MKTRIFILKPDNTFFTVNKNKLNSNIIKVGNSTYMIEPESVFYKLKKGLFGKQYRAIFYSEKNLMPLKTEKGEIVQGGYLHTKITEADYIIQDLLHAKVIQDVINPVKENLMLLVMAAGFGVLMGIIIGLAIGHVRI